MKRQVLGGELENRGSQAHFALCPLLLDKRWQFRGLEAIGICELQIRVGNRNRNLLVGRVVRVGCQHLPVLPFRDHAVRLNTIKVIEALNMDARLRYFTLIDLKLRIRLNRDLLGRSKN